MNKLNTSNSRDKSRVFSNPSVAHNVTTNPQYQLVWGNMKASRSRKKHSVAHIVTTNPHNKLAWRSMKQLISPQLLFEGGLTVKLRWYLECISHHCLTECSSVLSRLMWRRQKWATFQSRRCGVWNILRTL